MNSKNQELIQLINDFRIYAALDHEITLIYDRHEEPSQELLSKLAGIFSFPMYILKKYNHGLYVKYAYEGVIDNELHVFIDAIECLI